jgi:hypothetical protein
MTTDSLILLSPYVSHDVDEEDVFCVSPGDISKEVVGVEWYRIMYNPLVTDLETEIVLPIIWYGDKTGKYAVPLSS